MDELFWEYNKEGNFVKRIAILGSTGSIGTQTLEIVRDNPDLQVVGLAAGGNVDLLEKQVREFHPRLVSLQSEVACKELRIRLADMDVQIVPDMDGLLAVAEMEDSEILVTAIVGMIGIRPTIAAIKKGKDIALANKETLVTAGHIIMPLAAKMGVSIFPVDSEHSAIFQSLQGENKDRISKLLITASGGPFRGRTRQELNWVQPEEALKHPNWSMGHKITIDSATLVNKGLEVMEAKWLFDVELSQIEVVVHPQSILHSAVQYADGGIMGQMGVPDMKLPIQYALFYPDRRPMEIGRVDLCKLGNLTFERPDTDTFCGLALAYRAAERGGSLPTVFNAANEKAVALFLDQKIRFLEIPELIEAAMEAHRVTENPTVEEILAAEAETYEYIRLKGGE